MHSSPSFNGPPPAPPPPFPSSFSFFLLFMFSCFAVSAWGSTVGGVTCLSACTRGVTNFNQRRWQSASWLAKHIFLRLLCAVLVGSVSKLNFLFENWVWKNCQCLPISNEFFANFFSICQNFARTRRFSCRFFIGMQILSRWNLVESIKIIRYLRKIVKFKLDLS